MTALSCQTSYKGKMAKRRAFTITAGDQSENHHTMKKQGNGLAESGFSPAELSEAQKRFETELGCQTEMIDLNQNLENTSHASEEVAGLDAMSAEPARLLVVERGAAKLLEASGASAGDAAAELADLEWDNQFLHYGKVCNKKARYNLCFGKEPKEKAIAAGQGTVVALAAVPLLASILASLGHFLGPKADNLEVEGNYYYDLDDKGVGMGFHGDGERKKVVAWRLGDPFWIVFQWFYRGKAVGKPIRRRLGNGDLYIMSEKTSGWDWKLKRCPSTQEYMPTLRHAVADKLDSRYLKLKPGQQWKA